MLSQRKVTFACVFAVLLCCSSVVFGQAVLVADGQTAAYTQITNTFGVGPETPDCSHTSFGPHITEVTDSDLNKPVFNFIIHVTPDNDRCVNFDRQRLEMKTDTNSPDALKGFNGDTVIYQWDFKLPAGFQPSSHFTHIHQIKGGLDPAASGAPVITLTPRAGTPNIIQIIYQDGSTLAQTDLAPFLGVWVEAREVVTVGTPGTYSMVIKTLFGGQTLLSYTNNSLNTYPTQTGTGFIRPKWGIYRSLLDQAALRDEQLHFNNVCVAKAPQDCPSGIKPGFSVSGSPTSASVVAGSSAQYTVTVAPAPGFTSAVALSASGLPSGASASFNPSSVTGAGSSTMTVSTASSTPAATSKITVSGSGNSETESTSVNLTVTAQSTTSTKYEAEASGNTLAGTTKVASCTGCSGGSKIGNLGNGSANTLTLNNVNATTAGTHTMTIYPVVSGTRTLYYSVNGGTGVSVSATGSSWSATAAGIAVQVTLKAGSNTVKFYNNSAYAPDLDYITVK